MVLERTRHSLKSYSLAAIATNPRIMNREIKFRGKVKGRNEWKYGSLLPYADGECNIITETGRRIDTWNVDPETVGQYTGLKDVNGKDIYEGDIVFFKSNISDKYDYKGPIFYENGEWCSLPFGDYDYGTMPIAAGIKAHTVYPRIIGNQHDNPRLMMKGVNK